MIGKILVDLRLPMHITSNMKRVVWLAYFTSFILMSACTNLRSPQSMVKQKTVETFVPLNANPGEVWVLDTSRSDEFSANIIDAKGLE